MLRLELSRVSWPMRTPFRISRITETQTDCVHVVLTDAQGHRGRGEAIGVDYAGETQATLIAQLEAVRDRIEAGVSRAQSTEKAAAPQPFGRFSNPRTGSAASACPRPARSFAPPSFVFQRAAMTPGALFWAEPKLAQGAKTWGGRWGSG